MLHLRPLPPAPAGQVIHLPRNDTESRDAVIGHFASQLSLLVKRHGSYVGRHIFAEAVTSALADYSLTVDAAYDSRAALVEYFDTRLDTIGMGFA